MTEEDLRPYTVMKSFLMEMDLALAIARAQGEHLLKFRHPEGRFAETLRREIRRHKKNGKVVFLVKGEKFHTDYPEARYLLDRFPETASDPDLGKENAECTIVCISMP